MSTGSDEVVLIVKLQGAAGGAPAPGGSGGTAPAPSGPTPSPAPAPIPGSTPSVSNRWWWLPLIQNVPGTPGLRTNIRAGAAAMGVGGVAGAAGLGVAFGAGLFAAVRALGFFVDKLNVHSRAVDDLADRLAAGPQIEAIKQIQATRLELSRMQRAERFAPILAGELTRRTTRQIAFENLQTEFAEMRRQLTTGAMRDLSNSATVISSVLSVIHRDMNSQHFWENTVGLQLNLWGMSLLGSDGWLRLKKFLRSAETEETTMNLDHLIWALSPDNPTNQPFPDRRSSPFRATFGDTPPTEPI